VLQGTGEELAGGGQISFLADHDVDDLAELVDRVGVPAGSGGVDHQWGEMLYPALDAHVIDVDATLDQQFFGVSVGSR
jgi:hypothetical protein